MTTTHRYATAIVGGGLCLFATAVSLFAQNTGAPSANGSLARTVTVSSTLSVNDNYDLSEDSPGTSSIWNTLLQYSLSKSTPIDSLTAAASGNLRFADLPVVGQETAFDNGRINADYQRRIDDSSARFQFDYSDADIEFFDPLRSIAPDGSFDDTLGEGRISNLTASANLSLSTQGAVSLRLSGEQRIRDYRNTTSSSLRDLETTDLFGEVGLEVSPGYRWVIDSSYATSEQEDNFVESETISFRTGLIADLRPTTKVDARLGYSDVDTQRTNGRDVAYRGSTYQIRLDERLPNGSAQLRFERRVNTNGRNQGVALGRTWVLPTLQLTGDVGLRQSPSDEVLPAVNVSIAVQRPTTAFSLSMRQSLNTSDDGSDTLNTSISSQLQKRINPVSSWGVSALYGQQHFVSNRSENNDVQRASLGLNYNYALNADWQLTTGYTYQLRDEDNVSEAQSNEVFATITRRFVAR